MSNFGEHGFGEYGDHYEPVNRAARQKWKASSGHPGGWRVTRERPDFSLEEYSDSRGRRRLYRSYEAAQRVADALQERVETIERARVEMAKRFANRASRQATRLTRCKHCKAWINLDFGANSPADHSDAAGTKQDPRSPGDWDDVCDQCYYGDGLR